MVLVAAAGLGTGSDYKTNIQIKKKNAASPRLTDRRPQLQAGQLPVILFSLLFAMAAWSAKEF